MLAKGFIIGIQFEALFTDNLFFELAKHANDTAKLLKNGLSELGVKMASDSPTNQQFIQLSEEIVRELKRSYQFEIWERRGNKTTIRLVTSWATEESAVVQFLKDLNIILKKAGM
jgi:threonine aldolase